MFVRKFLAICLILISVISVQAQNSKSQPKTSDSTKATTVLTQNKPIEVYFGPRATDDSGGVYYNLFRFLDSAKTSLYGCVHEIDMITVAKKLVERAEAGVDVQLVVEAKWLALPKDSAAINLLKNSKVKLIPDTKKSGLMHNKFFIADKIRVWTGSTNLTEHCLLFNYNNAVWLENDKIAQNFLTEFYKEREGHFGKKDSGKPNTPYPSVIVGSTHVNTYFSPEDMPMYQVVSLVNRAKRNIDILCFVFSSQDISEALLLAQKRGVKIRVLFDNSFSSPGSTARWKYVPFKELSAAGIACKYDDEVAKVHHKVIIVDGHEVLTGSFNFSNNAAKSNNENLVIVDSADIAGKYETEFEKLWSFFNGDPGEAITPDDEDTQNGDPVVTNEDNN